MSSKSIMKLGYTFVFSAFFLTGFSQATDEQVIAEINAQRQEKLVAFKGQHSPLEKKQRKKLKSLNYYPIDLSYRVQARLIKTETPQLFVMKTTTTRAPEYRKYGELFFTLKGVEYKLEVYQSPESSAMPLHKDRLFLPFTDKTNGAETYDVGRYIDLRVPESDQLTIDFNLAYNPYCSYNHIYSCVIPPAVNDLPIEIKAGEKKFH